MSYFIDVQGTLIDDIDKKPIAGAIDFIKNLNQNSIPYVVVTNNTKEKSEDFYQSLIQKGFDIPFRNYLDPFMLLKNALYVKRIYGFGPKEFIDVLYSLGYKQNEDAEAILIASSMDFDSKEYALMIEKAITGAKIVGMHATSIYAKNNRRYPGVGAILQMLSYASGKEYDVIGKPSESFYKEALRLINEQKSGINFSDITMISDDAIGDLCGIKELGAKTILVLSGKCKDEQEVLHVKEFLDVTVENIGSIKV